MCEININGVNITLTEDQLRQIKEQTDKNITVENLNYSKACKLIGRKEKCKSDYDHIDEWYEHQLKTIIKAANWLDNNGCFWTPDFTNQSERKYYNWFERKASGWVLYDVDCQGYSSDCSVGFYFKKESTARIIANNHTDLYSKILG